MADTRASTGLTVEQWDDKFFTEYLTENRYAGEMGTNEGSVIQVKETLTKKPGDRVNFALVNKLTNDAVTGRDVLEGQEEDMSSRSYEVAVEKRRNAVRVSETDEQFSAISLRDAMKHTLKEWSLKDTERLISKALGVMSDGTSNIEMTAAAILAAANQTALDAWLSNNSDRVYFGNNAYVASSGDLSVGLATQTAATAAELLTIANLDAMKFIAINRANPKIRPIRSESKSGRHFFLVYAHPLAFRDLQSSSAMQTAQKDVMLQMENERLFKGGDLYWNGMIIKEAYDLYDYSTLTAASGSDTVVPVYLCGAQAVGTVYAKRWTTKTKTFDYDDKYGVAIEAFYGIDKLRFGTGGADRTTPKDNGILTGFFASSTAS